MYAFKKVLIGIIQLSNLMRFTTINYKIKNSVSYLPTFLNGIQAAIEFDWNLKLGSSLYIKRLWAKRGNNAAFAWSARRTRNSREVCFLPLLWLESQTYLTMLIKYTFEARQR